MSVITLLTDFGLSDPYAGIMKGVILSINPDAQIIDISHQIAPQDIDAAAHTLFSAYPYFPPETIHVVVVDPGVGSARRIVCISCRDQVFIAPDNGVLTRVIDHEKIDRAVGVENPVLFLHPVSRTFHGRDIFAPVAAHLSNGRDMGDLGPALTPDTIVRRPMERPLLSNTGILSGVVVQVDRFGNLVTSITKNDIRAAYGADKPLVITIGPHRLAGIGKFYGEVPPGTPLALFGSSDRLEISVCSGNAGQYFGVCRGAVVRVYPMERAGSGGTL